MLSLAVVDHISSISSLRLSLGFGFSVENPEFMLISKVQCAVYAVHGVGLRVFCFQTRIY